MSLLLVFALLALSRADDICLCLCDYVAYHTEAVPEGSTCDKAFCEEKYIQCKAATHLAVSTGAVGPWEGTYAPNDDPKLACNQTTCCCLVGDIVFEHIGDIANITTYNITSDVKGKDCPENGKVSFDVATPSHDQVTSSLILWQGSSILLVHLGETIVWYNTNGAECPGTFTTDLKTGLSTGAIIGIVVGSVVGVVVIIAVCLYARNRGYEKIH